MLFERRRKLFEWELAEIKHDKYFIPYGVDWRDYFDHYPFDHLFKDLENLEKLRIDNLKSAGVKI